MFSLGDFPTGHLLYSCITSDLPKSSNQSQFQDFATNKHLPKKNTQKHQTCLSTKTPILFPSEITGGVLLLGPTPGSLAGRAEALRTPPGKTCRLAVAAQANAALVENPQIFVA